ncbi:hypothetical protein [Kibdelosporangium aridum]|uniref:hypothetical protein n=1 Tax=Kibdelosporangium aridum TaxID=2030 RepID=UPI0035E9E6E1
MAESAPRPEEPASLLGRTAEPLTPRAFTTSYADGGAQTVAVTARKSLGAKLLNYRVDQSNVRRVPVRPWAGGKVYGGHNNVYYDEYRGRIEGARPGATVEFWFSGVPNGTTVTSPHVTYTVANPADGDALVWLTARTRRPISTR